MNKIIIVAIVVVLAVAGFVIVKSNSNDNKNAIEDISRSTNTTDNTDKTKTACELLTLEDAKSLIGQSATLAEGSGGSNLATTESVKVDNCTYSSDGATLGDLKQITIQIHSSEVSQIKQSYESYKKEFPGEALAGLGDSAYYATEAKQVGVLKGGHWLLVFGGSINAGDEANKQLDIETAQIAIDKL
ncbi:MAG: hypothetical protein M3Q79_00035 [bacterium]|nr:hypothetical protein [bacterium]